MNTPRTLVISGATGGIGRVIASYFYACGWDVLGFGQRLSTVEAATQHAQGWPHSRDDARIVFKALDVTGLMAETVATHHIRTEIDGRMDALVIGPLRPPTRSRNRGPFPAQKTAATLHGSAPCHGLARWPDDRSHGLSRLGAGATGETRCSVPMSPCMPQRRQLPSANRRTCSCVSCCGATSHGIPSRRPRHAGLFTRCSISQARSWCVPSKEVLCLHHPLPPSITCARPVGIASSPPGLPMGGRLRLIPACAPIASSETLMARFEPR